jgi:glycosyltransferase involved in cell wall biosynthesis
MRILFIASLHHPEALREAIAAAPPGAAPLFPPSVAQHFYEKELRARGHELAVFYRNLPAWGGTGHFERHSEGLTPGKIVRGLLNRLPPQANPDVALRNRRLREQAAAFRPDWLWLVGDNRVIAPQTLAAIKRETGCKLLYTTGVSPIVFSTPIERAAARLYDLVLSNDFYHGIQWLELGAARMECLPISACDPDFHRPHDLTAQERAALACDVAFVGTLVPDHLYSLRRAALESLRDFDLGIWSVHDLPQTLQAHYKGAALGESNIQALSAAKITLNVHGDFMRYGGNMRLFEAAGAGIFQIADDLPGIHEWFTEGETIVTFRDTDDLRAKVRHYLTHDSEREAIARRAREHVYAHHTYRQRVDRLEALLGG